MLRYQQFVNGRININQVLNTPSELVIFIIMNFLHKHQINLQHDLVLEVNSEVPCGFGLGTSAAVIVSVLFALHKIFNIELIEKEFLSMARDVENLQHGISSGLDIHASFYGGLRSFMADQSAVMQLPELPLHVVFANKPLSSSGECVMHSVSALQNVSLQKEFKKVYSKFCNALENDDFTILAKAIQHNQKLLLKLGVVPNKVQEFLDQASELLAYGKICGAGDIKGDDTGVMLLLVQDEHLFQTKQLVENYGFSIQKLTTNLTGVHCV